MGDYNELFYTVQYHYHSDDIYDVMLMLNHGGWSITIARLARGLDCSTRTVHRNMCTELKREKELLNKQI